MSPFTNFSVLYQLIINKDSSKLIQFLNTHPELDINIRFPDQFTHQHQMTQSYLYGFTPLQLAISVQWKKGVQILKACGADETALISVEGIQMSSFDLVPYHELSQPIHTFLNLPRDIKLWFEESMILKILNEDVLREVSSPERFDLQTDKIVSKYQNELNDFVLFESVFLENFWLHNEHTVKINQLKRSLQEKLAEFRDHFYTNVILPFLNSQDDENLNDKLTIYAIWEQYVNFLFQQSYSVQSIHHFEKPNEHCYVAIMAPNNPLLPLPLKKFWTENLIKIHQAMLYEADRINQSIDENKLALSEKMIEGKHAIASQYDLIPMSALPKKLQSILKIHSFYKPLAMKKKFSQLEQIIHQLIFSNIFDITLKEDAEFKKPEWLSHLIILTSPWRVNDLAQLWIKSPVLDELIAYCQHQLALHHSSRAYRLVTKVRATYSDDSPLEAHLSSDLKKAFALWVYDRCFNITLAEGQPEVRSNLIEFSFSEEPIYQPQPYQECKRLGPQHSSPESLVSYPGNTFQRRAGGHQAPSFTPFSHPNRSLSPRREKKKFLF